MSRRLEGKSPWDKLDCWGVQSFYFPFWNCINVWTQDKALMDCISFPSLAQEFFCRKHFLILVYKFDVSKFNGKMNKHLKCHDEAIYNNLVILQIEKQGMRKDKWLMSPSQLVTFPKQSCLFPRLASSCPHLSVMLLFLSPGLQISELLLWLPRSLSTTIISTFYGPFYTPGKCSKYMFVNLPQ